jgi:hypothetical protein
MTVDQGRSSPLRSVAKGVLLFLVFLLLTVGSIVLYAGVQNYFEDDHDDAAFTNVVLGLSLVSLPLALLFTARASRSYRRSRSQYELPDTPLYFFTQTFLSAGFLLLAAVSLMLYLVYVFV